ncbi:hypothetical protein C7M84_023603 [Penaeus vannamei]|uniref:Uncharacterized protein n=1 Tax=Penaeus vannamei TaxID=6689 RepID=A0A423U3E9_PENVA|nr:hypothetical protein C7M84_023603 [Penaeus vannamei]
MLSAATRSMGAPAWYLYRHLPHLTESLLTLQILIYIMSHVDPVLPLQQPAQGLLSSHLPTQMHLEKNNGNALGTSLRRGIVPRTCQLPTPRYTTKSCYQHTEAPPLNQKRTAVVICTARRRDFLPEG